MRKYFADYFKELKLLLKSVSPLVFALFIVSVFSMNLLANKSVDIPLDALALDCGIVVSWVAFLCMDILTKHYGPKAATQISVITILINIPLCAVLYAASVIPGTWGAYYSYGEQQIINDALNSTFGGTWYVLLGSTAAFIASAFINNFSNYGIGKIFKKNPDGFGAYVCRSYLSTALGQFADNIIFALAVSHVFFGWTLTQCFTCAATGMVAELICEAAFSPLGYKICKKWSADGVGREYLEYVRGQAV